MSGANFHGAATHKNLLHKISCLIVKLGYRPKVRAVFMLGKLQVSTGHKQYNYMKICLLILFLSRKNFHAKHIFVPSSSMKLGPRRLRNVRVYDSVDQELSQRGTCTWHQIGENGRLVVDEVDVIVTGLFLTVFQSVKGILKTYKWIVSSEQTGLTSLILIIPLRVHVFWENGLWRLKLPQWILSCKIVIFVQISSRTWQWTLNWHYSHHQNKNVEVKCGMSPFCSQPTKCHC